MPNEDGVRTRAYEIWIAEGCPGQRALEHWLQAAHELSTMGPPAKAPKRRARKLAA